VTDEPYQVTERGDPRDRIANQREYTPSGAFVAAHDEHHCDWREVAEAFLDAWWEWEPGEPTEPLDAAASRAMILRGDTITLAEPRDSGKPSVHP
jgi:hypothetical protein